MKFECVRVIQKSQQIYKVVPSVAVLCSNLFLPMASNAAVISESTHYRTHYSTNRLDDTSVVASAQNIATPEAILFEINRARQFPAAYAAWLETLRGHYAGTTLHFPGERSIRTAEGTVALDGAIAALSQRSPQPPLTLASGLVQATRGHLDELLTTHRFTLSGLDGSSPLDRAERYGSLGNGRLNELLNEGFSSAEAIVAFLIIDDGNRSRSTQDALLSADVTALGSACGQVGSGRPLCVLDYATAYTSVEQLNVEQLNIDDSIHADSANQMSVQVPEQTRNQGSTQAVNDLSQLAADILVETNALRANPAAYAQKLIALRQYYHGNWVALPGQPRQEVVEGVAALDEAIAVLQSTAPLPLLAASNGMNQGARDHAADLGEKNMVGHYGSDNSDPFVRISRYGKWDATPGNVAGENISYGYYASAEWHVIQLLVDDNVPGRGHRETLLKPDYRSMGAACELHPTFNIVCVMTYASEYEEH